MFRVGGDQVCKQYRNSIPSSFLLIIAKFTRNSQTNNKLEKPTCNLNTGQGRGGKGGQSDDES